MAHVYKEIHSTHPVVMDEPDYFDDSYTPAAAGITMLEQIVYFIGGVIMMLLATRFLLSVLGANTAHAFVGFIYNVTEPLVAPFFGLINYQPAIGTSHFEFATLIAILVYGLVAVGIAELISLFDRRRYAR